MPSVNSMLPRVRTPPFRTVSGQIKYGRFNMLSGHFKVGKEDVYATSLPEMLTLRASKWVKIKIDSDGLMVKLINAK